MTRSGSLLCVFVLIFGFTSCSGDSGLKGEAEMKEFIAAQALANEALYNDGRQEKMELEMRKLRTARKKLADLKLSEDQMKKLVEKYQDKLTPGTKFEQ